MHHMMLETTHYRENITDARCIREMHEAPLQALNILARYPHKKGRGVTHVATDFSGFHLPLMSLPVMPGSPHWRCTARAFHTERACRDALRAIKKENVGEFFSAGRLCF